MNPQNAIVLGCLVTALLAYLLVLWSGSRIGHGVVIAAVSCLGIVAIEHEGTCKPGLVRADKVATPDNATDIVLAAIRRQMEINHAQR